MDRICAGSADIRLMDSECPGLYGMPSLLLMENAARGAAEEIIRRSAPCRAAVLAGAGNNGGDGFAIARQLAARGFDVHVYFTGPADSLGADALLNYKLALRLGTGISEIDVAAPSKELMAEINSAPLVVDAVFGVGFRPPLRDSWLPFRQALCPAGTVCAIDIPSGIDSDTGMGEALCRADYTLTFHAPKPGLFLYPGRGFAGEVKVIGLGIDYKFSDPGLPRLKENFCIPPRDPESYKGTFGHVGIIAGRLGMTGAALLAARAALACGAGLVSVAAPAAYAHIYETASAESMTVPIDASDAFGYTDAALEELLRFARNKTALAIGPGFGRNNPGLVCELLRKTECRIIADADALWSIGNSRELLREIGSRSVLTPHYGEMSYLTGLSIDEIKADKLNIARMFAREYNTCLVLKGPDTITAYPDRVYINTSGCAGMAGGGSGDVLCGMLAAGHRPEDMVYLHGLAGEKAAEAFSEVSMTAMDIVRCIPECIKQKERL